MRFPVTKSLVLCGLGLLLNPGLGAAQSGSTSSSLGRSGLGIFGGQSAYGGQQNYSGFSSSRNFYQFGQSSYSNISQAYSRGTNVQTFHGSSNVSPYINLMRSGNAAVNYYGSVRPQVEQQYRDWATSYKLQERRAEEAEMRRRGYEDGERGAIVDWALDFKRREKEGEREARLRRGEPDIDMGDWGDTYQEQMARGEAKANREKRGGGNSQKANDVRTAQRLKQLEAQMGATAERNVPNPAILLGTDSFKGPGYPSHFRSYNHWYPTGTGDNRRYGNDANQYGNTLWR